uniref:Aryl-alcohol oxidase-like protein n=1 Tax=Mycena chlorophos TaxID=658473 RepID=A0ABQ0LM49_MYCCL|nr:aryl-alcohol oxidase-like protein [Mycena chlorophos]
MRQRHQTPLCVQRRVSQLYKSQQASCLRCRYAFGVQNIESTWFAFVRELNPSMEDSGSSSVEPHAQAAVAGGDAQDSEALRRTQAGLKRPSESDSGLPIGQHTLGPPRVALATPRMTAPFRRRRRKRSCLPFKIYPAALRRVLDHPARFYREEFAWILEDPRMSIGSDPNHFGIAATTPFGGGPDEREDLRREWRAFVESSVKGWNWYSRVEAAFVAFVFVAIQTADANDLGTYSISYLALGASSAALATCQLLVYYFDDTVSQSLHYAYHFEDRRKKILRVWWRPSLDNLLLFAYWNHFWCTVLTTIAFCYSFIQTTNGSILVTENVVLRSRMGKVYVNPEQLESKDYDLIVVGAGNVSISLQMQHVLRRIQAGGVVAARLAENPSFKVLVIEAGLSDKAEGSEVLRIPLLAGRTVGTPFDWNYATTPQPGLDGRAIPFPRGFVVGGCSNTNSLVYIRGPAEDFDRIAKVSGDSGWSWANMGLYRQKNERHVRPWNNRDDTGDFDPTAHGYGPLQTSLLAGPNELDRRVIETTKQFPELFPFKQDLNSGDCLGVSWLHKTIGDGARSSSSTAFLNPALQARDNIDLLIHTQVTRLLPNEPGSLDIRTVELAQSKDGPTCTLTAKKEVILCAGTIGTPQILQLSGIGPKDVLDRAGVAHLVDLPDVGQHLQDQLILFYQWRVNIPTLSSFLRDPANVGAAMAEYASSKTGFAAGAPFYNTIAFLRAPADELVGVNDPAAGPNSAHFVLSFINTFLPNPGQSSPAESEWISFAVVLESMFSSKIITDILTRISCAADYFAEGLRVVDAPVVFPHSRVHTTAGHWRPVQKNGVADGYDGNLTLRVVMFLGWHGYGS